MTAPPWQKIKAIFQDALERRPEDRDAFLESACGADPSLRSAVDRLLRHDRDSGRFLEPPEPGDVDRAITSGETTLTPGTHVGPYRIRRRLASGGMGTVFLADRDGIDAEEGRGEPVAVKLIKRGMDTEEILGRFQTERETLKNLSHPNIGKLLDAGATEDGRPYLVMEYIDGEPIDRFCDIRQLSIRDRLRLLYEICLAVEFAHQNLVVHRDLKPSNILVTEENGSASPKIIDFGIAKLVGDAGDDRTSLTVPGQVLGSPYYMSPEQASPEHRSIDTRTDIYSLGVLLYRLLVGVHPFESASSPTEFLRKIREEDAPPPSTRMTRTDTDWHTVATLRGTDHASLRKQIRGDLDWITSKAIERDRARRYGAVSELADDLGRFLRNDPVSAGPPSPAYRLRKLVKRHRVAFAVATLLVVAILAGSVAGIWWFLGAEMSRLERQTLSKAAAMVHGNLADAHLWFEEAVADDESIQLENDVYRPIDDAIEVLENIRSGRASAAGPARLSMDEEDAATLLRIEGNLRVFRTILAQRWEERTSGGRTGGTMDQRIDALYESVRADCTAVIRSGEGSAGWRSLAGHSVAVNLVVLLLFVAAAVLAFRKRPL